MKRDRVAKALTSLFLLLCVAGLAALRMHAERVRRKGERLQAEALTLTPGVTTLGEVRAFVSRAERPAGYAGYSGPQCDESECVVSIGPMAFVKEWQHQSFRRLAFLGIRPADYSAIVRVRGGLVREVTVSAFYGTGSRQITSTSVILVEQLGDINLPGTAAMDREQGIALCSGFDRNESGVGVPYAVIGIATKTHPQRISLDLSCVTSFEGCSDIRTMFHPEDSPEYRTIIERSDATCSSKTQLFYP
ncbi:MAG: hypothetical protein WCC37_26230 [Candidatus Sulfotelmatobacter sp.]|jgi:hypothetical protein